MFPDCTPKKYLILVVFQLFRIVFWGPTGQPGAPFLLKACILAYNNIFLLEVPKNRMFLYCIPKKYLIFVVFQLFLVVFLGPTGQPGAPFLFKACILAYNNIFFIKVPKNWTFLDCIPKNTSFQSFFQLFLVVFWAPMDQPGAPFLFKACILAYNNISLSNFPRIGCFLTVYPKIPRFSRFLAISGSFLGPQGPAWGSLFVQSLYSSMQ